MSAPHLPQSMPHVGISHNQPQSPEHQPLHGQETAGKVIQQPNGTLAGTEAMFFPPAVFWNRVMNLMGRGLAWKSLGDRRLDTSKKGADSMRQAAGSKADNIVDPISGRPRTSEVSLTLNLMRDDSGDDQRHQLEHMLKERKLNPTQRLHVYFEAAASVDSENLPADVAGRIKQALVQSMQEIQSENRHAIRQAIHDPEKLRSAMEAIAGPVEKLMTVMQRELRNRFNPDSPHTEMNRIDVPHQALSLVMFGNKLVGPAHCRVFLAAFRRISRFEDGLQRKSREVPNRNFPRYWLAMSDASAFNLAQTALAFGSKLRTDIASQTQTAPAMPAAEIAEHLLLAAENGWGKGMAESTVNKILGPAQLDRMKLSKVYRLVHDAIEQLPETAWEAKRLNARYQLLAELKVKGDSVQPSMPVHSIKEEIFEQRLLGKLQEVAGKARLYGGARVMADIRKAMPWKMR